MIKGLYISILRVMLQYGYSPGGPVIDLETPGEKSIVAAVGYPSILYIRAGRTVNGLWDISKELTIPISNPSDRTVSQFIVQTKREGSWRTGIRVRGGGSS